jgi:hypothetical protein
LADALKADAKTDAGSPTAETTAARPLTEIERKAALKQAQSEIERKYGPLTKADPRVLHDTIALARRLNDPTQRVNFLAELIGEIVSGNDPRQAQALRTALTPHFGAPRAAPTDQEPNIYVRDKDGNVFIDPQKMREREAWLRRQIIGEFQKELSPLKQTAEELRLEKQAVALDREVTTWSGNIHGYLKSLPDYAANRAEIAAAFDEDVTALLASNPTASPAEIENVAIKAYNRIATPKAASAAQAREQATLRDKARARTASPDGNGRSRVAASDEPLDLATELKRAAGLIK